MNINRQARVKILSKHYSAFRDGNESTIPMEELTPPDNLVVKVKDKITGKK